MSNNRYIASSLQNQDLERMRFSQNLRRNPADYSAYVNQRVNEMTGEVFNRKRTAFQKAQIDLGRYMDMDHNANFYKIRTGDVDRLSDVIANGNSNAQQTLSHDKDMTKRQFEINEWYNYNKLEFLFFLQLFFIATLTMVVIVYMQKTGTMSNALSGLLTAILMVIIVVTGVYRYFYTKRTRDTRLWHRRYFGSAAAPKPAAKCDPSGEVKIDLNSVFPKELTECADDAAGRFGKWQETLENEITNFETKGMTPDRISGGTSLGGMLCENLNQD